MALSSVRSSGRVTFSRMLRKFSGNAESCGKASERIFCRSEQRATAFASRGTHITFKPEQHVVGGAQLQCLGDRHALHESSSAGGIGYNPGKALRQSSSGSICRTGDTCHHAGRVRTFASGHAEASQSANPVDGSTENVEGVRVTHRFVRNGSVNIHYVECGDPSGQLAVLLHGWPSFWYGWLFQLKALTDAGYHVVIPDMRGYNLSDKPPRVEDYGRAPLVSDIQQVIEKTGGGKPAVLIAHDWGGAVAWSFVRSHPPLVSRLVILNMPEPSVFADAIKNNREQQKRSWYIGFFQLRFLPEWLLKLNRYKGLQVAYTGTKPRSPEFLQRHVDAFSQPGALTSSINYYRAGGKGYWAPPGDSHERIELPVKVIWGEDDKALGKELATPSKDLVPNSEVVFLPGVSHWCLWDEPEKVNAEILEFLARSK